MRTILFVAAENSALKGAKVGGVGDVVGQLPPALAAAGCQVVVAVPSYGFLHARPGSRRLSTVTFDFRGFPHTAGLYQVAGDPALAQVRHVVIDHPSLYSTDPATGRLQIYTHDAADRPFATDASRFAFFATAVAAGVCNGLLGEIDTLHLHDWHAALVAFLRQYAPPYASLKAIRTVYTIHNLALQGVRPFEGDTSSLAAWFPGLTYDAARVADPRWPDCINLMQAGIALSDAVNTVSPSYSREILLPSDPPRYYGGEGLEAVLDRADRSGHLTGILNGCNYPDDRRGADIAFSELVRLCRSRVAGWAARDDRVASVHFLAHSRLFDDELNRSQPEVLVTCVSRVVPQKVMLMCTAGSDGRPGLERILEILGDAGRFIFLGTGDPQWERRLFGIASRFANFIFLKGYSDACAAALYAAGDLFLMPSSFEPCGLSQMLAMRAGQPCVVHAVGGLRDSVRDGIDGFVFGGASVTEQVDAFVAATVRALSLRQEDPAGWSAIRRRASQARFFWKATAEGYLRSLYRTA